MLPLVSVSAQGPHAPPRGVIATEGGRFVDPTDGSTFHVAGANCYYLAYSSGADEGSYEHAWVEEVLDEASSLGLNVLRLWAFQDQWWEGERARSPLLGRTTSGSSSPSTVSSRERRRVASAFCSV